MRQIVNFNEQLRDEIVNFELACEKMCASFEEKYQQAFQAYNARLLIEFMRTLKGSLANPTDVYQDCYESFIDIGIEKDEEYFPNAHIPVWRCKKEFFQKIGYFTKYDIEGIQQKIALIIEEMLQEKKEESK
ncbi:hypothetical protein ABE096_04620 [Robertmurraya massiliosenegalensis]|uniref:hypothetical protein n=1 Tax=Robertmurraya TaxID=2837507 RepID=UPI0039A4EF68